MKRLLAFILVLFVLALTACAKKTDAPIQTTLTETQTESVLHTEIAVTEIVSAPETETTEPAATTAKPAPTTQPTTGITTTNPPVPEPTTRLLDNGDVSYPFTTKVFSTGSDAETFQQAVLIRSKAALRAFYADRLIAYQRNIASGNTLSDENYYETQIAEYDDAWFSDHSLIVLRISDSSGSYTHPVQSVTRTQSGKIEVSYKRAAPPSGILTCDMKITDTCIEVPTRDFRATDTVSVVWLNRPQDNGYDFHAGWDEDTP